MAVTTSVPVELYLNTTYHPDCDYVDGEVIERNVGEFDHARLQIRMGGWFLAREQQFGILAVTEQRVQVAPRRYRIPDITVVRADYPLTPIFREAPLVCVEILSTDDTLRSLQKRITDYLTMGVPHVWIIDPASRIAWVARTTGYDRVEDGMLRIPELNLNLPLADILPPK